MYQRLPVGVLSESKKYTLAYGLKNGNVVLLEGGISHTEHYSQIVIRVPNGSTLVWAALYEGEYTAETLPKYQPKGLGTEVLECFRYFQKHAPNAHLYKDSTDAYSYYAQFIVPMRIVPTVSHTGTAESISYVTTQGVRFNGSASCYVTDFTASAEL